MEVTLLAGRESRAISLYSKSLGGVEHLAWRVGDYSRGLRIVSMISGATSPSQWCREVPIADKRKLLADWGLYAEELGDLPIAEEAFAAHNEICLAAGLSSQLALGRLSVGEILMLRGQWPALAKVAEDAKRVMAKARDRDLLIAAEAQLASAAFWQGNLKLAKQCLARAPRRLYSRRGIAHCSMLIASGNRADAFLLTQQNERTCQTNGWKDDGALCQVILGQCKIENDPAAAAHHLDQARKYSSRTGNIEVSLRSYRLAADLSLSQGDPEQALLEAQNGVELADSCSFSHWSRWLRLCCASALRSLGEAEQAIQTARWVAADAKNPEANDQWALAASFREIADSAQVLGDRNLMKKGRQKAKSIAKNLGRL